MSILSTLRRALQQALDDFRSSLHNAEAAVPPTRGEEASLPPAPTGPVPQPSAEGSVQTEEPEPLAPETAPNSLPRRRWSEVRPAALVLGGSLLLGFLVLRGPDWLRAEPADRNVVATYAEGVVTREELLAMLEGLGDAERRALSRPDALHHLVQDIALHRVTEKWAGERQLEEQTSVKHALKHAAEEINIHDVENQIHQSGIKVDEVDIQRYYEDNRERLANRPLPEVRESIRQTLHAAKEKEFVQQYLRELWAGASVVVDYDLLAVPAPTEDELGAYYLARQSDFREPVAVQVRELRTAGKEREAREKAEKALARLQAGEDLARVAADLGLAVDTTGFIATGERGPDFDERVFPLRVGELSPVLKEGDTYYVSQVAARRRERVRTYDEVRQEINGRLFEEKQAQFYAEYKAKALFTIRGRRYTLAEFLDEYEQLPPAVQERYRAPEARKELVERLINRLLVLDTAASQMLEVKNKREIEDARRHVLLQMLHQEEMANKVEATDQGVRGYYERHRSHYAEPAKVKISYIRVGMGATGDSRQKARERIDEAARRLKAADNQPDAFAAVAREYSEDRETAARGGDLERWLAQGNDFLSHALAHDFNETVFRLKVGETSPVVAMGDSYYVVRLRERAEPQPLSFEQAASLAKEDLLAEKHAAVMDRLEAEVARRMQLQVYDGRLNELAAQIRQKG